MGWNLILWPFGTAIVRSFLGWMENSCDDGEVSKIELKMLGATILRTAVLFVATYLGAGMDVGSASVTAGGLDFVLMKLRNMAKVKKKTK